MKTSFSLLIVAAMGSLLGGCASYNETRPGNFDALWKPERGQWSVREDGTINGTCLSGKETSCPGTGMAALRGRVTLPANYQVDATITVKRGVLGELMLSWHDEVFTRVYLYSIEQKLTIGRGWLKLPGVDRGTPSDTNAAIDVKPGKPFRMSVTVCNKQATVWVNGMAMLRRTDDRLGYGTLGLRANGDVDFSGLKVTALDSLACPKGYVGQPHHRDEPGMAPMVLFSY